jgi:uncharacterized membrane protein
MSLRTALVGLIALLLAGLALPAGTWLRVTVGVAGFVALVLLLVEAASRRRSSLSERADSPESP